MAEPARQLEPYDPEDDNTDGIRPRRPDSRSLSSVPTDGVRRGGSHWGEGNPKSVPGGSEPGQKSLSPSELQGAEAGGAAGGKAQTETAEAQENSSLSSGASEKAPNFNYREEGKAKKSKGKGMSRFLGKGLSIRNKVLLAGGLGGLVLAALVVFLLFSSFMIPGLVQNITEWQFAKVSLDFADSTENVADEKLAIEAESSGTEGESTYNAIKDKFTSAGERTSELWSKLDKYRPSKVIQNLQTNSSVGLGFKEEATSWGGTKLTNVILDGKSYDITTQGFTRYIPALNQLIDFKNGVSFAKDFAPDFIEAMRADDLGVVARSIAANAIRKELGIGLIAWTVGKYAGKTPTDARELQAQDAANAIDQGNVPDNAVTSDVKNADSDAEAAEKACLGSDSCLDQTFDNGGIPTTVQDAVTNALAGSGLTTVIGIVSPAYNIAMPICIVYDGSLGQSGGTIDGQTAQETRAFNYVASAADQQEYGSPDVDPEAIGALNADLNPDGQIVGSNPEVRADGGTVDTTAVPSAEASADGSYAPLSAALAAAGVPAAGAVAATINDSAGALCPSLTNIWVNGVAGLAALGLGIATGGTFDGAAEAAGDGAGAFIKQVAQNIADKFTIKTVADGVGATTTLKLTTFKGVVGYNGQRFAQFLWGTAKQVAAISAATLVAHEIVGARSGQLDSGLAQGNDLANEADAGANVNANEIDRTGMFGRPLTQSEAAESQQATVAYVANQNSQKSAYQRYLALDNSQSLFSRIISGLYADIYSKPVFSSIFTSVSKIFSPSSMVGDIFGGFENKMASAAATSDTWDYGNLQFGWPQSEEKLVNSGGGYAPLENQAILDQSGEENAIAQKYAVCFGYKYNSGGDGSLDPSDSNGDLQLDDGTGGSASLGTLLANGDIVRDANGNIEPDQGLCSPDNLGTNNPQYGDLVFRWRLAMRYDNTLDNQMQIQNVGT